MLFKLCNLCAFVRIHVCACMYVWCSHSKWTTGRLDMIRNKICEQEWEKKLLWLMMFRARKQPTNQEVTKTTTTTRINSLSPPNDILSRPGRHCHQKQATTNSATNFFESIKHKGNINTHTHTHTHAHTDREWKPEYKNESCIHCTIKNILSHNEMQHHTNQQQQE